MKTLDITKIRTNGVNGLSAEIDVPESLKIMSEPSEVAKKGQGTIRVMTKDDGDKRIVWSQDSLDEIRDAKAVFDQLIQEGLVPYKVGTDGNATPEVMDEFDPFAEEVIFLPVALVTGG